MMNGDLVQQTNNAFEFVRKLYLETSYLIKEMEGLLQQEEEAFVIGRPSGYAVTSRTSSGLESINVEQWMPRTLTVFFCPESVTELSRGQTITPFSDALRLLILHIDLFGGDVDQPRVLVGYIHHIVPKRSDYKKFEHMMWEFAYNMRKVFAALPVISYQDGYCSFEGEFIELPLFSIGSSEAVSTKLIEPMLELYRSVG